MIGPLKRLVNNADTRSLAVRLRRRRFELFLSLLERVPAPVKVLDIGGTASFWRTMPASGRDRLRIKLLNLELQPVDGTDMESVVGDATKLSRFGGGEFDVVFSNSVIEHLRTFDAQLRMADEVRRVGKRYFVQTPNLYFPIEPHFLVPGFQFLPLELRARLLSRFDLGWCKRIPDLDRARAEVESIRLLSRADLRRIFPEAELYEERFGGMVKSFVAHSGW
ncbi:MAG: methyltransferase domain-containing protein [Gemmatimonadaceae bacterium]